MENPRFVEGKLGTHFIERETTLMDEMKQITEGRKPLGEKLAHLSSAKKRIAAMAAVAAITQIHHYQQTKQ
jgi:pyruvate carboxylase subunit A